MVAKVVKLAAVPAALGLASFRVYAMTEEKTDKQIAPRELSVYSAEPPALRYVEEKSGHLQTGLGMMRVGLQPYVRAVQNTCTSVKVGAVSLYQTGQDTYHFLREPPPGFLPRVGIITVSGLAGLILARKGSRLKRIGVPLALTAAATAVCYPMHTVGILKVTGKKAYTASSLVASAFKSKSKEEGIVPDASQKLASDGVGPVTEVVHQPVDLPEKVSSLPEEAEVSEVSSVTEEVVPVPEVSSAEVVEEEVVFVPDVSSAVDAVVEEVAPVPEVSSAIDAVVELVAPVPEVSSAVDAVVEEVAPVPEVSSAVDAVVEEVAPVPDVSSAVDAVVEEVAPVPDVSPAIDAVVEEAAPVPEVSSAVDAVVELVAPVPEVSSAVDAVVEEVAPVPDVSPAVDAVVELVAPVPDVSSAVDAVVEEVAPVPDVSPAVDAVVEEVAPVPDVSSAVDAVVEEDITQAEVVSHAEGSSHDDFIPVSDLAPENVIKSEVVLSVENSPVDTIVELAPQEAINLVTGDVALEAKMVPTEKTPVAEDTQPTDITFDVSSHVDAVTPTVDVIEVAHDDAAPLSEVSPTEDTLGLDTAPLSEVTLKEATSEDYIATEVKPLIGVAPEGGGSVSEDSPAIQISSEGASFAKEDKTPLTGVATAVADFTFDVEDLPGSAAPPTEASLLFEEETSSPNLAVEEITLNPLVVEEATPPSAEEITCPPVKEKPQFVPDPSLLDHGQAHPEDADLYSTRA